MSRYSAGRVAAGCVIGLLAGLIQPLTLAFAVLCVVGTVLGPVLYAWAGAAPALVYLAASLGSVWAMFGGETAAACLMLFVVPAAVVMALMARRAPYFTRMKAAAGAQLAAMLALVFILYAGLGRSLIDVLMERLSAWADSLPAPLVTMLLQQFALNGLMDEESARLVFSGGLTAAEGLAALHRIFDVTGEALRLGLPAMLLTSGLITGLFATLLPGKICSRRGDALEYVPVSGWYVPARVTAGVLVALGTALALHWTGVNGSESVLTAVLTAGQIIYAAAGAAALSRRFKETGRGMTFRVVLIGLALVFVSRLVTLIGVYSTLFGRRGLISGYIRKKMEDRDKGDDDL